MSELLVPLSILVKHFIIKLWTCSWRNC